jgi:hypothetical protein
MAKFRYINTRFWIDDYISNLGVEEKLFFLYLLTNSATEICGVYELPIKIMSVEIGIKIDKLEKLFKKFETDEKIYYRKSWVGIKNFIKHQSVNPKVEKGIEIGLLKAPKELLDSLCIAYDSLSHSNSNSNSNSNTGDTLKKQMYNYEDVDEEGNPLKKKGLKKISKEENNELIKVGLLWRKMVSEYLKVGENEVVMKNIYYPIRSVYNRDKFGMKDYQGLFNYFLNDKGIKNDNKMGFDLCMSEKYVAKYKINKKSIDRPISNNQIAESLKL